MDPLRRLALPAVLLAAACSEPIGPRIDEILPNLSRCLTPASAERVLGPPDEVAGSGLLLYGYRLRDGGSVWLSFPGQEPIVGAVLEGPDGARSELPLHDC